MPGWVGSPRSTATLAPLGRDAGASFHTIVSGLKMRCCANADVDDATSIIAMATVPNMAGFVFIEVLVSSPKTSLGPGRSRSRSQVGILCIDLGALEPAAVVDIDRLPF